MFGQETCVTGLLTEAIKKSYWLGITKDISNTRSVNSMRIGSHYYIEKKCNTCSEVFNARVDSVKNGMGKFCSQHCMGKSYWPKGHKTWNKGLRGIHFSPATEFKSREWKFKGTKIEYINLHQKIRKMFGTPDTCEYCNLSGLTGKKIHWANKSGRYLEIRDDWLRLCAKCHHKYDKALL